MASSWYNDPLGQWVWVDPMSHWLCHSYAGDQAHGSWALWDSEQQGGTILLYLVHRCPLTGFAIQYCCELREMHYWSSPDRYTPPGRQHRRLP